MIYWKILIFGKFFSILLNDVSYVVFRASTLYDKPPIIFKSITLQEKHDFLCKLSNKYQNILEENGTTKFTEVLNGKVVLKSSRPGLIVSSTSWTEDEDFSVLFQTLEGERT